jgi:hypothetical protein
MCLTCVTAAGVNPHQIACIGISTQRSSFITWHRETGEPFHNFITWRDLRADGLVQQWNKSLTMRVCFIEFCCDLVSGIRDLALGALCLLVSHRNSIQLKETKCEILLVGTSTEVNFIHTPINSFIQLSANLFSKKLLTNMSSLEDVLNICSSYIIRIFGRKKVISVIIVLK